MCCRENGLEVGGVAAALAELENHLNIADKTLAEFLIELAQASSDVDNYKQVRKPVIGNRSACIAWQAVLACITCMAGACMACDAGRGGVLAGPYCLGTSPPPF